MTLRDAILEARKTAGARIHLPGVKRIFVKEVVHYTFDARDVVAENWLVEKPGLTFLEAMVELVSGRSVRRRGWGTTWYSKRDNVGAFYVTPADVNATDWEVVED